MKNWRQTAIVPEKAGLDAAAMDSIAASIPASRQVLLACRTAASRWPDGLPRWPPSF